MSDMIYDPQDPEDDGYDSEMLDRKVLPSEIERALAELDAPDPWMWWYRTVTICVMLIFFLIGLGLIVGPDRWSQGNSISILHHHSQWLPVEAYGIPFIAVTLLLSWEKTRLTGYLVGLFFSSFFAVSAVLLSLLNTTAPPSAVPDSIQRKQQDTIIIPLHTNIVTLGLSLLGILLILAGMRYVIDERNRVDVVENARQALEEL